MAQNLLSRLIDHFQSYSRRFDVLLHRITREHADDPVRGAKGQIFLSRDGVREIGPLGEISARSLPR